MLSAAKAGTHAFGARLVCPTFIWRRRRPVHWDLEGPCVHCRGGWASSGWGLLRTRRGKVEKGETWLESLEWAGAG